MKSWAISRTRRWKGSLRISNSVLFWYLRISLIPSTTNTRQPLTNGGGTFPLIDWKGGKRLGSYTGERRFRDGNGEASWLLRWSVQISSQPVSSISLDPQINNHKPFFRKIESKKNKPWWRVASSELFLLSISSQSASYEPWLWIGDDGIECLLTLERESREDS